MRPMLLVHVLAGSAGIIAGFIALYSRKGRRLHNASGDAFTAVMVPMTITGALIAAIGNAAPALNIPAAVLTAYFVITGFSAVRPFPGRTASIVDPAATVVAAGSAATCLVFAAQALASPTGTRFDLPPYPFLIFGVTGTLGAALDLVRMRRGAESRASRLTRHLWRMSFALFVAALSFFIGQAHVIPVPLRRLSVRAAPVLAVLVTMLYWLWRVRIRGAVQNLSASSRALRAAPASAPAPSSRASSHP